MCYLFLVAASSHILRSHAAPYSEDRVWKTMCKGLPCALLQVPAAAAGRFRDQAARRRREHQQISSQDDYNTTIRLHCAQSQRIGRILTRYIDTPNKVRKELWGEL